MASTKCTPELEDIIVWHDATSTKPDVDEFVLVARESGFKTKDVFTCLWDKRQQQWVDVEFIPLASTIVVKYWAKFPSYPV